MSKLKEILRWVAVALGCCCALLLSCHCGMRMWAGYAEGVWGMALFSFGELVLCATPFYAVAYCCHRRRYRQLFVVFGVYASLAVFLGVNYLPSRFQRLAQLGFFRELGVDGAVLESLGNVFFLVVSFYAANWVLKCFSRLAGQKQ